MVRKKTERIAGMPRAPDPAAPSTLPQAATDLSRLSLVGLLSSTTVWISVNREDHVKLVG